MIPQIAFNQKELFRTVVRVGDRRRTGLHAVDMKTVPTFAAIDLQNFTIRCAVIGQKGFEITCGDICDLSVIFRNRIHLQFHLVLRPRRSATPVVNYFFTLVQI